jgi:hypothetical protein
MAQNLHQKASEYPGNYPEKPLLATFLLGNRNGYPEQTCSNRGGFYLIRPQLKGGEKGNRLYLYFFLREDRKIISTYRGEK